MQDFVAICIEFLSEFLDEKLFTLGLMFLFINHTFRSLFSPSFLVVFDSGKLRKQSRTELYSMYGNRFFAFERVFSFIFASPCWWKRGGDSFKWHPILKYRSSNCVRNGTKPMLSEKKKGEEKKKQRNYGCQVFIKTGQNAGLNRNPDDN